MTRPDVPVPGNYEPDESDEGSKCPTDRPYGIEGNFNGRKMLAPSVNAKLVAGILPVSS